jgi:hypothetical protein
MSKKGIYIFLMVLAVLIVVLIVADFTGNRPGKRPSNPFAYDMKSLMEVEPEQILYRETRNLRLKMEFPAGIVWHEGLLYVVGDQNLQVTGIDGKLVMDIALPDEPVSVAAGENNIYIGTMNTVIVLDHAGNILSTWNNFSDNSLLSSIAVSGDKVFIADAGRRRVYRYSADGERELEFEGKVSDDVLHGFIVPSGCFDLAINEFGDLWVANPGKHALENYTLDGVLRGYWSASFADVKGFSGCCNPAHFTFLPGGNFITSEKGILRIKEYKPSGEFVGVVAAPSKFIEDGRVPDVTADNEGRIYACDPDKQSIRIFERI